MNNAMTNDIHNEARNAQTELHQAIAKLETARAAYQAGAGEGYAQARVLQRDLTAKIEAAEGEAAAAEADFQREFAAAGFVRTEAVRQALARKAESLAMADAMRVALAQREQDTRRHLIDASGQGRAYADAHDTAYGAYAQVEAYEALQECGEKIARAMALCSHVPQRHSAHEDSLGRMHLSEKSDAEIRAARWAFILRALATMAKECTDYAERPVVDALGALELGALSVREFLSPAQVQVMRRSGEASVPVPPIA